MARAKKTIDPEYSASKLPPRKVKQVFHLADGVDVTIAFYPDRRPTWKSKQDCVEVQSPSFDFHEEKIRRLESRRAQQEIPQERPGTDEKLARVMRSGGRDFLKASGYEEQRAERRNPNRDLLKEAGLPDNLLDPDYLNGLPGVEGVSGGADDEN